MVKVGDKVKILSGSGSGYSIGSGYQNGDIVEVKCVRGTSIFILNNGRGGACDCGKHSWILREYEYQLIEELKENKQIDMLQKFAQIFMSEPNKSFRKAGITNSDYSLTTDGQSIFLQWLLKKNGDEFKKEVVDELLKEVE